jgi:hypothetical protein
LCAFCGSGKKGSNFESRFPILIPSTELGGSL